jgi:hypothetical protein
MYGFDGVVRPWAAALASGELEGGRAGGALVVLGGVDGASEGAAAGEGAGASEGAVAVGAAGGCDGPITTGAMPSNVCFGFGFVVVGGLGALGASGVSDGAGSELTADSGAVVRPRTCATGGGSSGSDSSGSSHDAVKRSARRSASLSLSGATDERSGSGMAA